MTRKIRPQPGTKAELREMFVCVRDGTRKLFDIRGPFASDAEIGQKVYELNNSKGCHWNICSTRTGPCFAETVRSELQRQFHDHTFVADAMAETPVKVVVTKSPLEWLVP